MCGVKELVGLEVVGVHHSIGTNITLDLAGDGVNRSLWLRDCGWRVVRSGVGVFGCEDSVDAMREGLNHLVGLKVTGASLSDFLDITLGFEKEFELLAFVCSGIESEHWALFWDEDVTYSAYAGLSEVVKERSDV